MSWLFDRLCEISVADRVDIVLPSPPDDDTSIDDSTDLVDLLVRAASVPQLTVTLLPRDMVPTGAVGRQLRSIDLDDLPVAGAMEATRDVLDELRTLSRTALRVRADTVSLHDVAACETPPICDQRQRLVVATDLPGWADHFRSASATGLGISIGGTDPSAQVQVPSFIGVVSILDALVALRTFAFGVTSAGGHQQDVVVA